MKPKAGAKSAASKKRAKPDSENELSDGDGDGNGAEDDDLLSSTPPSAAKKAKKAPAAKKAASKPLANVANESFGADGTDEARSSKEQGASEKYQKVCGDRICVLIWRMMY